MARILTNLSLPDAVDAALARLVSVRHTEGVSHVHLPIFYPSGAAVTVSVERTADGYLVSDEGFAFREVELVGADDRFPEEAKGVADASGLRASTRAVSAIADVDSLAGTIADVAAASAQIAHEIAAQAEERHDATTTALRE